MSQNQPNDVVVTDLNDADVPQALQELLGILGVSRSGQAMAEYNLSAAEIVKGIETNPPPFDEGFDVRQAAAIDHFDDTLAAEAEPCRCIHQACVATQNFQAQVFYDDVALGGSKRLGEDGLQSRVGKIYNALGSVELAGDVHGLDSPSRVPGVSSFALALADLAIDVLVLAQSTDVKLAETIVKRQLYNRIFRQGNYPTPDLGELIQKARETVVNPQEGDDYDPESIGG